MGDAGEGWIDAEARIQERMEELQRDRSAPKGRIVRDPTSERAIQSLKLARTELSRQLEKARHAPRKTQITQAIKDLDSRIAELQTPSEQIDR